MKSNRPIPIFTTEQIDVMHSAFAAACGRLGLKPGDRGAEDVAVRIVNLAATGVCELDRLPAAVIGERRPSSAIAFR